MTLVWFLLPLCFNYILCENSEDYWKNFLPVNYTTDPPILGSDTLVIKAAMTLLAVTSISEDKLELSVNMKIVLSWEDYRLQPSEKPSWLSPFSDDSEEEYSVIPAYIRNQIWRPKVYISNSRTDLFDQGCIYFFIKPNLELHMRPFLKVYCPYQFHNYPFDVQQCFIRLQYDKNVKERRVDFDENAPLMLLAESPTLQLDITKVTRNYCTLNNSVGNFSCLELQILFRRRLGPHITQTFIPSAMIVVLSWFSFWLDVEAAPARISLGVTALLTLSTSFSQTQRTLPAVAYMKAIDLWMFGCVFYVFMSLVEFTGAYTLNKKNKARQTELRKQIIDRRLQEKRYYYKEQGKGNQSNYLTVLVDKAKKTKLMSVDEIARIVFPASYVLCAFIYFMYYSLTRQSDF